MGDPAEDVPDWAEPEDESAPDWAEPDVIARAPSSMRAPSRETQRPLHTLDTPAPTDDFVEEEDLAPRDQSGWTKPGGKVDEMPTISRRTAPTYLDDFNIEGSPTADTDTVISEDRVAFGIPDVVRRGAQAALGAFDSVSGASSRARRGAIAGGMSPEEAAERFRPVEIPERVDFSPAAAGIAAGQVPTLGHLDEISAGIMSAGRGTPYRDELASMQARDEGMQRENPGSYTAGTVAATLPMMALPGGGAAASEFAAARGAGTLLRGAARVAGSAAEGGAFGGGMASGSTRAEFGSDQYLDEVGSAAGQAALLAGGAQGAMELPGLTRAVAQRVLGSGLQDQAARLRIRAAGGRTADIQRMAGRQGGVAGFADGLRDAGLTGTRATTAEIAERAGPVREQAGARIGEILREASESAAATPGYRQAAPSVDGLVERIRSEVVAPLQGNPLPEARAAARNMERILESLAEDRAPLTPERIHDIQRTLDSGINWRAQTVAETSVAGARRAARGVVRDELDRSLEEAGSRIGDPGLLDEYSRNRRAFGAASEVADWTEREAARGASNRLISPTDYITTAGAGVAAAADGDFTAKDAAYAVGGFALNRFVRRREHSLAATGLEGLSRALSGPQTSRLSPSVRNALSNAAARGPAMYAATVYSALHSGTPEDRETIQAGLEGGDEETTP